MAQLITKFELQVNDVTELSSAEELDLANDIYLEVCADRPWEFLKTSAAGTILADTSGATTVYYITTPSDFSFFSENRNYTDNSISNDYDAAPRVIFVGTNRQPYQIVNYSDRMQYVGQSGFAYLDLGLGKIIFTGAPSDTTYQFDYIKVPARLVLAGTPIFPAQFHKIIPFGMAMNNDILQKSPKAKSYMKENGDRYDDTLLDMAYHNAQLINN